jgi:hypothetical protein
VAALAYRCAAGPVLWLANLGTARRSVRVSGFQGAAIQHVIDEKSFLKAIADPGFLDKGGSRLKKVNAVELGPYAVMRLAAVS